MNLTEIWLKLEEIKQEPGFKNFEKKFNLCKIKQKIVSCSIGEDELLYLGKELEAFLKDSDIYYLEGFFERCKTKPFMKNLRWKWVHLSKEEKLKVCFSIGTHLCIESEKGYYSEPALHKIFEIIGQLIYHNDDRILEFLGSHDETE